MSVKVESIDLFNWIIWFEDAKKDVSWSSTHLIHHSVKVVLPKKSCTSVFWKSSFTKLLSHKLMIALLIGWLSLVIDFYWSFRWSYIWKEWDVFSISSLLKLRICNQALKLYLIMQLLNDWDLIANRL